MKQSAAPSPGGTTGASTPNTSKKQSSTSPAQPQHHRRKGGIGSMFDDLLDRLKMSARIFLVSSFIAFVVIFAILFYIQRPIDDVAAVSSWSPFEVEVWFRRQKLEPASEIMDGFDGRRGYIDGQQLTMLSLNDLRKLYRDDGREDDAVDVYRALQQQLRPLAPISIWFVITVIIQTGFIYGVIFFILLCWAVRWVKKKVDANPMVQQMKMLTQAMAPPPSSASPDEKALMNPMMNPMLMNPLLNPFGPMMAMQNATAAAAMAQANTNNTNNTDDPTAVVDNPVAATPNALMDPTAMMMANPFLFPFGPLPPPSANGDAAAMPPMFPFMPPPPGLVARAAARRRAAAAATNWTPEVD